MSCNCEYGICDQTAHCPVRATPVIPIAVASTPPQADEPTDKQIEEDQPMLPLDAFDHFCVWSVLICLTVAFCFGVAWLVGLVANSAAFAAAQDWISTAAQALVSALPMTPFF
ncbi:hypothetical protein CHU94_08110 [Rhodoferax sp. TH121]|uniref:hypothetical protein n=1 Tax=Rhodoferax sp. TH121 TaxID=2022803 RepID=UPI000B965BA4|nr:hypothetical protein [Rhodoferax sp. TH121]OYQ41065.1 hypothetical protein CHU94_08110 [Rhodoferax sp. TH121]